MQPLKVTPDELIKAIRWRLGIPADAEPGRSDHILDRMFSSSDAGNQEQVRRICRFLNDALETAVRQQLGLPSTAITSVEEREFHESLWRAYRAGSARTLRGARRACRAFWARPFPAGRSRRPRIEPSPSPRLPRRQAPRPT